MYLSSLFCIIANIIVPKGLAAKFLIHEMLGSKMCLYVFPANAFFD